MRKIDQNSPWQEVVYRLGERQVPYVLVTVLGVQGSTPRDTGTKMVVTGDALFGSIGGGHLEFKVTQTARTLLASGDAEQGQQRVPQQLVEHFALGANLGQCCGGRTSVLFEVIPATGITIALFGAGHVGQALVQVLGALPVRVLWIDNRPDMFPEVLPDNVSRVDADAPVDEVADIPPGSYYLVLTHNHALDFDLCEAILGRGDARYFGLIGSATKWARFRQQLIQKGYPESQVENIDSPVGLSEVPGKQPMEVAVSIAGKLIQEYQADRAPRSTRSGVDHRELVELIQAQEART